MKVGSVWRDDWDARLREAVTALGFSSMRDFAASESGVSLPDVVASRLRNEYAPIQVAILMGLEAARDGWTDWFIKDLLVRVIREYCPAGWSAQETRDFDRAHAIGVWVAMLKDLRIGNLEVARRAGRTLMHDAPGGWEPSGPDDIIIGAALT